MNKLWIAAAFVGAVTLSASSQEGSKNQPDNTPPPGFRALFNGKDLTNWQGLIDVKKRAKMSTEERKTAQAAANDKVLPHWKVEDGVLVYDGKGNSLQTVEDFGNVILMVDWKIEKNGDSGIYLRGQPQVQIWDPDSKIAKGIGSGGLYNNQKNERNPLVRADNPTGQWNHFEIKMVGDKVTVKLNDKVVVDNTPLENYWERGQPLPARGPIELQHHGDHLWFKNIYVKELPD